MKIFEFESDPTSTIISVAEVIRTRAANNNAPAKMDIGNFLQMVNNAGHASLDYSGLKAYFDAEPKLANVIQAFNDQEIVFVGHGDEEETAELTPPSGEAPPEEKVNKMAKRAMKARESIEEGPMWDRLKAMLGVDKDTAGTAAYKKLVAKAKASKRKTPRPGTPGSDLQAPTLGDNPAANLAKAHPMYVGQDVNPNIRASNEKNKKKVDERLMTSEVVAPGAAGRADAERRAKSIEKKYNNDFLDKFYGTDEPKTLCPPGTKSAKCGSGNFDPDDRIPPEILQKIRDFKLSTQSPYQKGQIGEDAVEESPVAQAVLNRLIRQHADVVGKYGPEKVMDAVDELADVVGDVEEIGSSDVSIWTREVIEELEAREKGLQPKGLKPTADAQAYMDQMDNTHALIYNKQNRLKTGESVARGLNRYFEKQKNILKENSNYSEGDFVIINGIAYVLEKSEDGDWWGVSNNAEYEIEFTPGMEDHHQAIGEGKSPHPKGSAKYKKHMAAMHAGMSEEKEVEEGYYVMPPIDRERYTDIPGLEGPFTLRSGKVVYYDPKEGQYYDRDSDMYMSYEEYMQHDSPSMQQVKKEEVEVVEEKQKPYVSVVDGVWTVQDSSGEDVYSSKDKNKAMRFFNKYYDDMLESDDLEECPSPGPVKDYDSGPKDPYRWIRELVPTTWGKM